MLINIGTNINNLNQQPQGKKPNNMKTIQTIFTNIEAGNAGMNEAIFCLVCVILVAGICMLLPNTGKQTAK